MILGEIMTKPRAICVFCGSKAGDHPAYEKAAMDFGRILAREQIRLVYGGGGIGLMGIIARACHSLDGKITGVIPRALAIDEVHYTDADENVITENMHQRRHEMYVRSDAFVVLPGGIGTLEETMEVLSWASLNLHRKPLVLLNTEKFWDPLIHLFDHCIEEGFAPKRLLDGPEDAHMLVADDVSELLPLIKQALTYRDIGG